MARPKLPLFTSPINLYTCHSLITEQNAKTSKGEAFGYLTGILYLSPADKSGVMNVCPKATPQCRAFCLDTAGRGAFDAIQRARIARTHFMHFDRPRFEAELESAIAKHIAKAKRAGLTPVIRVNGTSDQPQLARKMAARFPDCQFYDYTKIPNPAARTLPNYHLTFSLSESNQSDALHALETGVNVAVVFSTKRGRELPATWRGYKVVDGDRHDLRFLDARKGKGVVVGLRAKGKARKAPTGGFVQLAALVASAGAL